MVTEEQLSALDLTIWLGSTDQAANAAYTNQSTISRRNQKVLKQFGIQLERSESLLAVCGDLQLLNLERQVHQLVRLKHRKLLRLQAPFWLQQTSDLDLPEGWIMNSLREDFSCADPITLLREHVLDACLATPTQISSKRDDLIVLELHQRPINLNLLNKNGHNQKALKDHFYWCLENNNLELKLMPFLPTSCLERSKAWLEELQSIEPRNRNEPMALQKSQHSGQSFVVSYLTPEMRMAQSLPWQVDAEFEPYTYTEHLVVLAKNINEPSILALIENLERQIGS